MEQNKLTPKQKAKAIIHLAVIALFGVAMIVCLCQAISCEGDRRGKKEKEDVYNPKNKDHKEPTRSYSKLLNDLQEKQIVAAEKNGIKGKFTREDLASGKFDVVHVKTCNHYVVEHLTHSSPYLVPKAATLLDDLGKAFQDSIYNRGYNRKHRFIVTSVTRTQEDVKKLAQTNVNATENSCHCYGTTFDISYARFERPATHAIEDNDKLYDILMQVALDFRTKKRCYVKWERKQKCLHITVR